MPTYEELAREAAYRSEYVPTTLAELREATLEYYDWPGWRIGIRGDNKHLRGYHRSRRWINESQHCTSRSYSVTETVGNRTGGSDNALCGMDIVTGEVHARAIAARINTARAKGLLPKLRECRLESGPWHVHLGFDRGMVDQKHDDIYRLIIGYTEGDDPMILVQATMPQLSTGSEGSDVTTWQTLLTLRGFATKPDGVFGPITHDNTVALQRKYGAESIDGIVGPETWVIGLAGEDQPA